MARLGAEQAAKEIASKPPVAIWGTKQVLHYARDHSTEDIGSNGLNTSNPKR